MVSPIHIPKVGMTMEEGELVRWLAEEGAKVRPGTVLFEMETDKVEIEVEAETSGILRQLVSAGTRLKPGAVVGCLLASEDEAVPAEILALARGAEPVSDPSMETAAPAPAPARGDRVASSPAARRLARELGVDIDTVAGTGPGGRITEEDVRRHQDGAAFREAGTRDTELPYAGRRRTIGERMHRSLRDSAQFTLQGEFAAEELIVTMQRLGDEWGERIPLLTPLVMKAVALALTDHPLLNAVLEGNRIRLRRQINIGFAADLAEGLMVPVIRDVAPMQIRDLAYRVQTLVRAAQAGELTPDDLGEGTFTVSSLAGLPVDSFTPVLNPPQVAVLGIGRLRDTVRFVNAEPRPGKAITLSLTVDHRIVDGAPAGRFLEQVGRILEQPEPLTHQIH